jgi:hypothetical protein
VALEQAFVGVELVGAEVRYAEAQPGVRAQQPVDALGRAEGVRIALVVRALRLAAGVHHERPIRRDARLGDLAELVGVGREALHVAVELHAREAHRERLLEDRARARLARQHGGETGDARLALRDRGHRGVQRARHARRVRVGVAHDALDAAVEEEARDVGRAELVADRPAVLLEPAPDRLRDAIGEEVHVRVDHGRERRRHARALRVVHERHRRPPVAGEPAVREARRDGVAIGGRSIRHAVKIDGNRTRFRGQRRTARHLDPAWGRTQPVLHVGAGACSPSGVEGPGTATSRIEALAMSFLSSLVSWAGVPYSVALGVAVVFALMQMTGLLGLLAGGGDHDGDADADADHDVDAGDADADHDVDADHDADADADHDADGDDADQDEGRGHAGGGFLAALGIGKVPLSIVWQTYAVSFAIAGFAANAAVLSRTGALPTSTLAWSLPLALVAGYAVTRGVAGGIAKVVANPAAEATSRKQLVGHSAVVISSKVDAEFGEVRLTDKTGHVLRVLVRTRAGEKAIREGREVVVVEWDKERDWLYVAPLDEDDEPPTRIASDGAAEAEAEADVEAARARSKTT